MGPGDRSGRAAAEAALGGGALRPGQGEGAARRACLAAAGACQGSHASAMHMTEILGSRKRVRQSVFEHENSTNLIDEVLEVRRVGVEPVEVGVQGEVGEGLPGRLVALDLDGVHADGRVVADGRGGHHGDAVHRAVAHLAAVLEMKGQRTK